MYLDVSVISRDGSHPITRCLSTPKKCPHCGVSPNPIFLYAWEKETCVPTVQQCTSCGECYYATYSLKSENSQPLYVAPDAVDLTLFSDAVLSLSPDFVNVYNQAEKAESYGLTDICGCAYRKALEHLVFDYAISLNPESEAAITVKPLSRCIREHLGSRFNALATASAWIGNDETHHYRKHEEYDYSDMKRFIRALVSFIESEIYLKEAAEFTNALVDSSK